MVQSNESGTGATVQEPGEGDARFWAQTGTRLSLGETLSGTRAAVDGKYVSGPIQGFGRMWQKTYRVRVAENVAPSAVISTWKARFPEFWPKGSAFHAPITGIAPGEIALLDISLGPGAKLSTGVLVLYADDESFTLMTPQGHVFSGWITFSAFREDDGTMAQAQVLMRASDPICELGLTFGGHTRENHFWEHTLGQLAHQFGGPAAPVETRTVCVDSRRQWSRVTNTWHNGAVRTTMRRMTAPLRWRPRRNMQA